MDKLNLVTIAKGKANYVFQQHLAQILENIVDERTSVSKPRKIMLEFDIRPEESRTTFGVTVKGKSVLAPLENKGIGEGYISTDEDGNLVATSDDPEQIQLGLKLLKKQKVGE